MTFTKKAQGSRPRGRCARVCRVGDLAGNGQHRLARDRSDSPYHRTRGLVSGIRDLPHLDQEESRRVMLTQVA